MFLLKITTPSLVRPINHPFPAIISTTILTSAISILAPPLSFRTQRIHLRKLRFLTTLEDSLVLIFLFKTFPNFTGGITSRL